jgi:hypothetical protein
MQSYWLPDLEFINMCFGCITLYRGYLWQECSYINW